MDEYESQRIYQSGKSDLTTSFDGLKVEIGTELASVLGAPLQPVNNTHATGVRMLMQLLFLEQERPVPTPKSLSATNHHLWWERKMMI